MTKLASIYELLKPMDVSDGLPIGSFTWWFGIASKIPAGWLICNGQSCAQYSELCAILGSNNVPDLMNEFIKGSTTAGVRTQAGLPLASSLTFDGSQSSLAFSGTTNEAGKHTHAIYGIHNQGCEVGGADRVHRESDNEQLNWLIDTGEGGEHTHSFNGTVSVALNGTVTMGSDNIYGKSDTVTPANVSAIPIIKAFQPDTSSSNSTLNCVSYITEYGTGFKNYQNATERTSPLNVKTYNVAWLILSNGLKICWGEVDSGTNGQFDLVYLPLTYTTNTYWFSGFCMAHDEAHNLGYATENGSRTVAECRQPDHVLVNTNSGNSPYEWLAIGK